ncbi:unnamed protein product, partial [marine sediment metagenome]
MIALEERVLRLEERQEDMLGNAGSGRAHTAYTGLHPLHWPGIRPSLRPGQAFDL